VGPRLDRLTAHEVAAAYGAKPVRPRAPAVVAAYAELEAQTDVLFVRITEAHGPGRIRVVFTGLAEPYATDGEMIGAVRREGILEVPVSSTPGVRSHPVLGSEPGGPYDRFRAVHDILGHVRLGLGFDRDEEFAVWWSQDRQYRGLARWALATELHGEHSVRWTTGQCAEHKAVLLHPELVARARRGRGRPHVENGVAVSTSG
jgi:hypothetical protein